MCLRKYIFVSVSILAWTATTTTAKYDSIGSCAAEAGESRSLVSQEMRCEDVVPAVCTQKNQSSSFFQCVWMLRNLSTFFRPVSHDCLGWQVRLTRFLSKSDARSAIAIKSECGSGTYLTNLENSFPSGEPHGLQLPCSRGRTRRLLCIERLCCDGTYLENLEIVRFGRALCRNWFLRLSLSSWMTCDFSKQPFPSGEPHGLHSSGCLPLADGKSRLLTSRSCYFLHRCALTPTKRSCRLGLVLVLVGPSAGKSIKAPSSLRELLRLFSSHLFQNIKLRTSSEQQPQASIPFCTLLPSLPNTIRPSDHTCISSCNCTHRHQTLCELTHLSFLQPHSLTDLPRPEQQQQPAAKMINMIQLAVILLITAWASALEVTFRRFATTDCLDEHHINKDTHLNNPHCKTFDEDEPVFRSFMAIPEDNKDEIFTLNCSATVYSDKSCMGNSFSLGGKLASPPNIFWRMLTSVQT